MALQIVLLLCLFPVFLENRPSIVLFEIVLLQIVLLPVFLEDRPPGRFDNLLQISLHSAAETLG